MYGMENQKRTRTIEPTYLWFNISHDLGIIPCLSIIFYMLYILCFMYIVFNIILAIQMDLSHYPLNRLEMVIRSILHNNNAGSPIYPEKKWIGSNYSIFITTAIDSKDEKYWFQSHYEILFFLFIWHCSKPLIFLKKRRHFRILKKLRTGEPNAGWDLRSPQKQITDQFEYVIFNRIPFPKKTNTDVSSRTERDSTLNSMWTIFSSIIKNAKTKRMRFNKLLIHFSQSLFLRTYCWEW